MKYRATFSDGPMGDKRKVYDFEAHNEDEAWAKVYAQPTAKNRTYTDVTLEEVEDGPKNIGIGFGYEDLMNKRASWSQYMIIRAVDEKQAVEYYNEYFKGKHFYQPWPTKIDPEGNCIYGAVKETYYAACPGFDFDATCFSA